MGLLDYVTSHSMDEDYAHVSAGSGRPSEPRGIRPGTAAIMIVGLFGLLLATAAVQTSRTAVASQDGRQQLVDQIEARTAQVEALRERIAETRIEVAELEERALQTTGRGRVLSDRLDRLGVLAGSAPVQGPGVRVVVDDAPGADSPLENVLDGDLQKLANALWLAGAEAISINGQRLTTLSAIRQAGDAITVNNVSLSRPYTVKAIGNPDTMPARFVETAHGSQWLDLQATYGLQFEMTTEESLRVSAANRLTLRHAVPSGAVSTAHPRVQPEVSR